jgi:two-component system sensor histidine kinase CpxA
VTRLPLRIFLSFFAALATFVAGAILITWLTLAARQDEQPGNPLAEMTEAAAHALSAGGRSGLEHWLADEQHRPDSRPMLIVDAAGNDLLGRPVPARASRWLGQRGREEDAEPRREARQSIAGVRIGIPQRLPTLTTDAGEQYRLLLLPRRSAAYGPLGLPDTRLPILLVALLVTVLASYWLARSIIRPIGDLQRATEAFASGHLETRVAPQTSRRSDEIGRLAGAFDSMAARLADLIATRERLLRDVSHELRSPLARMRLAIGLARQGGADTTRQVDRLETEIARLDALIGSILDVSRLSSGSGALNVEAVDLVQLVDALARDARFEAQAQGRELVWQAPPAPIVVQADPLWLSSAIENVVRNALRYTPPGTRITIDLRGDATLSVTDEGPGIAEGELEKIFEPFYRVAADRDRQSGGTGLGLAIAARAVQAHGGSISAQNRPAPQHGLVVTLRLAPSATPTAPSSPPPSPPQRRPGAAPAAQQASATP